MSRCRYPRCDRAPVGTCVLCAQKACERHAVVHFLVRRADGSEVIVERSKER